MIFELPEPVLGFNYGFVAEAIFAHEDIKVTIRLCDMEDGEPVLPTGSPRAEDIVRRIRGAEYDAFLASQRRPPRNNPLTISAAMECFLEEIIYWLSENGLVEPTWSPT